MKISKEILKQIKKYDSIVIARHIGADPVALGSQFALKEIIDINLAQSKIEIIVKNIENDILEELHKELIRNEKEW